MYMFNCFKPTRVVNEPAMVILDLDFRIVHCTTEFTSTKRILG